METQGDRTALICRRLGPSRGRASLLLALEVTLLILLYLSLLFVPADFPPLRPLYELFVKRPVGSALIFLSFSTIAYRVYRSTAQHDSQTHDTTRIGRFITLLLLLSAIGNFMQSIAISFSFGNTDAQSLIHWVVILSFIGDAVSILAVLTVWSLYWALETSPIEEIGALTSILLSGGLVVVWARAGHITGTDYWTNLVIIVSAAAAFALDVYTLVLACGLVMGKRFRSLTMHWRRFTCFVATAAAVSLVQDRLGYEFATRQGIFADQANLLKLNGLETVLWAVLATLWALAVVSMDMRALEQGARRADA